MIRSQDIRRGMWVMYGGYPCLVDSIRCLRDGRYIVQFTDGRCAVYQPGEYVETAWQ